MNNSRTSPLSSCKNLPPIFRGAFAPSFIWRTRPCPNSINSFCQHAIQSSALKSGCVSSSILNSSASAVLVKLFNLLLDNDVFSSVIYVHNLSVCLLYFMLAALKANKRIHISHIRDGTIYIF